VFSETLVCGQEHKVQASRRLYLDADHCSDASSLTPTISHGFHFMLTLSGPPIFFDLALALNCAANIQSMQLPKNSMDDGATGLTGNKTNEGIEKGFPLADLND
jgi:hypothetical protein